MRIRILAVAGLLVFAAAGQAAENVPLPGSSPEVTGGPTVAAGQPPGVPAQSPEGNAAVPQEVSPAPTSPMAPEQGPGAEARSPEGDADVQQGVPAAPEQGEVPARTAPGMAGEEAPGIPAQPSGGAAGVPRAPGPVGGSARPGSPAGPGFLVKFNNADIYEVIHTLGRMAGINYLIDPRVRGVVNVQTQGTVRKEGALELLFSILKINGATAVREGDLYHIVPMAEAKTEPLLPQEQKAGEGGLTPNRPVMRAFPLQYISATEMAKVIQPFVSPGGDVTDVPRANMVLVVDTEANMEKHERLVELFDADAFRAAGVKMFPLAFLGPEEMAANLESIFGALDFGEKGGKPKGINFVPLPRMNALLVVTASPKTMENIERWIRELDKEPTGTSRTVYMYRVRHGKVEDMMKVLEKLYPGKASVIPGKTTEFKPKVAEPALTAANIVPRQEKPTAPAEKKGAEEKGQGFDIIMDEPTNSIIIRGSASEYAALINVLKVIDVYPLQVLLEVLIAEVELNDELRLGVDWKYMSQGSEWSQAASLTTSTAGLSQGFLYAVEKTDRLMAAVRALADDGKVSILSSPSVISTNGKKSKIEVAQQIPVATGQVTTATAELSNLVTETVEYVDVGIILDFTPYINHEGLITLEINQNVSEVSSVSGGALGNPTFLKRSIETTMLASQDRSIVLGGLVQERRERSREGIPFLYKIPVVGWLFGSMHTTVQRTELLIFITPRVIESVEEGTQLSREFEDRVQELKKRITEAEGLRPVIREPQRPNE